MKKYIPLLSLLFLVLSCSGPSVQKVRHDDVASFFSKYNATGTFVLQKEDEPAFIYNEERAARGFIPASTFKILNSLVALETGVIGVDDTIPWDGVKRAFPAWNQDQRMREAFQRSTVWFYQLLARRIGQARMQQAVSREHYGNENIAGGIDQFWLTGSLRISALQQIDLLKRLKHRKLGFSEKTMQTVEDLMLIEQCNRYTMRGKTGWGDQKGVQIGWLVGYVERDGAVYYYAMNVESSDPAFPMIEARKDIVRSVLLGVGVIDGECR